MGVGQRLKKEREAHSWSQSTLAEKVQTSVQNINRWEHDKSLPQPHYRSKLCEVFGKTPNELFSSVQDESELIWNVPYRRNLYFTGRENILQRLHSSFLTQSTIVLTQPHVINGLGGIGKTQIALEYAYLYENEYKAILWVQADSQLSITSNFMDFASLLNLQTKNKPSEKIIKAVKNWLETNTKWLLILDNIDDIQMALTFIPTRGTGHVLLTTRNMATGTNVKDITINKMSHDEGILFLLRRAKLIEENATLNSVSSNDLKDAETINSLLDGLPLALDQAGAFIEETGCSLADYLLYYQSHEIPLLKRVDILNSLAYPDSVATTWLLSLTNIEQRNPAAAELLQLCAFLDPDSIPEEIAIRGAAFSGSTLQTIADAPMQLANAIEELRKYSFVNRNLNTKTFVIHRLVQVIIQDTMDSDIQILWAGRSIRIISHLFPEDQEFAMWQTCERYLRHAIQCEKYIEKYHIFSLEAMRLLYQVGGYLRARGQYAQAKQFYEKALTVAEKASEPDAALVTDILHDLAFLYKLQGKFAEAEPLYIRTLAIDEKRLPPTHNYIAGDLNNLAMLYYTQGKYEKVEPLLQRALSIDYQNYGPIHPDVAIRLNNLGMLYNHQEKYEKAEKFHKEALAIRRETLPPTHPHITASLNNLGMLYFHQGEYDKAASLIQEALSTDEQALGSTHPDLATGLNNLARVLNAQGKCQEAEVFCQRALAIRKEILEPTHYDMAGNLQVLADIYCNQEKYDFAEEYYKQAISIYEEVVEPTHRGKTKALENYASLLHKVARYDEALKIEARIVVE